MSLRRSQQTHVRAGTFIPRLEALEDRLVPANLTFPFCNAVQHIGTLGIAVSNHKVSLADDGAGNVTVRGCPGGPRTFHRVTDIEVKGSDGRENVSYDLTGNLKGSQTVNVKLRGGDDTFGADIDANGGPSLQINADGGAGTDTISLSVNRGLPGNLQFSAQGGAGNNTLAATLFPGVEVSRGTTLGIDLRAGGPGNDTIKVLSFATVNGTLNLFTSGPNGRLVPPTGIRFAGSLAEDVASKGTVNGFGLLTFHAVGGSGVNHIDADLVGPAFQGTMDASVSGGPLNDTLRLTIGAGVNQPPGQVTANLDGMGGSNDTCVHTANVIAINCENDTTIP
jgi:hypothetical protein